MASIESLQRDHTLTRESNKERLKSQVARAAADCGVLLVRTTDLPTNGLLSARQQQWVNSATYDARTENPVLYKHEVALSKVPHFKTERDNAKQEVQSLPDIVARPVSRNSSGVEARLHQGRKERHESTIQDMKDELALISTEYEDKIKASIHTMKTQLADNDTVISKLYGQVSEKEDLLSKSLADLGSVWESISSQTTLRQGYIGALDNALHAHEASRAESISQVLRDYSHQLSTIAFILPTDVERLIDEEAYLINNTLLENRQTYAQLCMHLLTGELSGERERHDKWQNVVSYWKELVCEATLSQFQTFLASEPVCEPPELQRYRDQLSTEQNGIQRRRVDLLDKVSSFAPPKATKTSVYELRASANTLHQQLETAHTKFLLGYNSCLESVSRECEAQMERCKLYLVESGAIEAYMVHKVLNERFLPLLEKLSFRMRSELSSVERGLDTAIGTQRKQFESLFMYCQGAASLWDQHTDSRAYKQRAMQEKLDTSRAAHDRENQNLEANLDLLLDRLRQGPTQEALREYLDEATKMLNTIMLGYETFHSVMLAEVRGYPELVQTELASYDTALCQYLGVSRTSLKKSKSKISIPESRMDSRGSRAESRQSDSRRGRKGRRSKPVSQQRQAPVPASPVEEVITTSGGVQFFIVQTNKPVNKDNTFLTQDEESEDPALSFATENISMTQDLFTKAQERMMVSFLEHLEQWKNSSKEEAIATLSGKEEECHTELDLRLHLHQPRQDRVEKDIHNVRLTELTAHRERITRHSTGLTTSLALQRNAGERLKETLQTLVDKLTESITGLVTEMESCNKLKELLSVQARAKDSVQGAIDEIARVSTERKELSFSVIDELKQSNTSYRASIKLFSEGGNYCPEEVELFVKKLSKLSSKITATHSHISAEMRSVTEQHLIACHQQQELFNNLFQLHQTDLCFLERVSKLLTSAQVLIKSEVAVSNSQSLQISESISKLEALLETKGSDLSAFLSSVLPSLLQLLTGRVEYLYCSSSSQHYRGSRIGVHSSAVTVKPIASMNITKSIAEHISRRTIVTPSNAKVIDKLSVSANSDVLKKSGRQSSRRKGQALLERKNINFGVGGGEDGSSSFMPKIRAILNSTHAELYDLTEGYYKTKGSSASTRPHDIHENIESQLDSLIAKTQSYRSQAEEYRHNCIEEFRGQLSALMQLMVSVPGVMFTDLLTATKEAGRTERQTIEQRHSKLNQSSIQQRSDHERSLRPNLGHPSQAPSLEALVCKEEQRHNEMLSRLTDYTEGIRQEEVTRMQEFASAVNQMTVRLLTLCDDMVNETEVIPGGTCDLSKERPAMHDLLRQYVQKQTGEVSTSLATQPAPVSESSSGKVVWPALPQPKLLAGVDWNRETITSKKCSRAHEAVIRDRDNTFQLYCSEVDRVLEGLTERKREERALEDKWFDNWTQSVKRVEQLY